jgi:hypothetical protein
MVRSAYLRVAAFDTRAVCPSPVSQGGGNGRGAHDFPHFLTRLAVAYVLTAAGTLKLWSVVEEGIVSGWGLFTAMLACAELVMGILLLVRRPGSVLWRASTLTFASFACASGYFAAVHEPTCGCFGDFAIPPVWTLALDLALVAALVAFPPPLPETNNSQKPRSTWAVRLATGLTFASLAIACSAIASPAFAPVPHERDEISEIRLDPVDLGVVKKGGREALIVWLRNNSNEARTVYTINTSCDCITTSIFQKTLPANGKLPVIVAFDGTRENDFVGSLRVKVSVNTDGNRVVDVGIVNIEITGDPHVSALVNLHGLQ